MRTKTLLLTAALSAAGLATSMAQTVYSVNAVGYVNLKIPAGFSIVANPLNNTGSGNNVTNLFAAAPEGTTVYKYSGTYQTSNLDFGDWSNKGITVNPGEAVFVKIPTGGTYTNTFVGDVMSGNLTNNIPTGFSIRSSQVPQAGLLETDLKFSPRDGDEVYQFDATTQKYLTTRIYDFGAWNVQPTIAVGEGFFLKNSSGAARTWTRAFSIGN
jgi:hypothetical protein